MHFNIFKMIATRGFLTAVECTKSVFGRGSAPDWGSSRRSPRPPSRLGRGTPPPHSQPPSTPSATRLVPKTPSDFFSGYGPGRRWGTQARLHPVTGQQVMPPWIPLADELATSAVAAALVWCGHAGRRLSPGVLQRSASAPTASGEVARWGSLQRSSRPPSWI